MARRKEEAQVEFGCIGLCDDDPPVWMVDGRWNAEGEIEPSDDDERNCPECGEPGEPTDPDVRVADTS